MQEAVQKTPKTRAEAKSTSRTTTSPSTHKKVVGTITEAQRLRLFRLMVLSRRVDDTEMQLKRMNRVFFQISGAGHEATLAAAAMHLDDKRDWFFPYYRDRALCLGLGVTPLEMFLQSVGAASDPASGGRQMPSHWGHAGHNIVSQSSPTGTQFLNAVGCAEAGVRARRIGNTAERAVSPEPGEVVYVSSGEGTTSQGEFFEALNSACTLQLPIIFHIEDNGYAISVPVEVQTATGSISTLTQGYPLKHVEFDGCDAEASFYAWGDAVAHARSGAGPVLMHSKVVRPYSHSMSDDQRLYRARHELDAEASRDPIVLYKEHLLNVVGIAAEKLESIETAIDTELAEAREAALLAEPPEPSSFSRYVFSPDVDPCGAQFKSTPRTDGGDKTMIDLINVCLRDEMHKDERIIIFGEDVADASRSAALKTVKGKGGVFKATHGLQRTHGDERVFNAPLAEANIVGRAVGMAVRGLRPVVEIQFFDYIFPAMMQIRSELAVMRWRSNNAFSCPVVIRSTYGGYLKGGSVYHSQTGESLFTHIPGLRVVLPSNGLDANGLLRTAMRSDDPVLFLEHKHLYRQTYNRAPYPGDDFTIPFGEANIVREGKDLTVVCYGALVKRAMDAAKRLDEQGVQVEVIDLRTLSPYDWPAIEKSVRKTSRLLVAYEDGLSWGSGSEIAARAASELFEWLDAPVARVASTDTFVGYHPGLEDRILPQIEDVVAACERLMAY